MNVTYRDLVDKIFDMDPKRMGDNLTILDNHDGEYYPVSELFIVDNSDDVGHNSLVLRIP